MKIGGDFVHRKVMNKEGTAIAANGCLDRGIIDAERQSAEIQIYNGFEYLEQGSDRLFSKISRTGSKNQKLGSKIRD